MIPTASGLLRGRDNSSGLYQQIVHTITADHVLMLIQVSTSLLSIDFMCKTLQTTAWQVLLFPILKTAYRKVSTCQNNDIQENQFENSKIKVLPEDKKNLS